MSRIIFMVTLLLFFIISGVLSQERIGLKEIDKLMEFSFSNSPLQVDSMLREWEYQLKDRSNYQYESKKNNDGVTYWYDKDEKSLLVLYRTNDFEYYKKLRNEVIESNAVLFQRGVSLDRYTCDQYLMEYGGWMIGFGQGNDFMITRYIPFGTEPDDVTLYRGTPNRGSEGPQLQIVGWYWDSIPNRRDQSNESGRIMFRFEIDEDGYVTRVITLETTVGPKVVEFYKKQLANTTFSQTNDAPPPPRTEGIVTFVIKTM